MKPRAAILRPIQGQPRYLVGDDGRIYSTVVSRTPRALKSGRGSSGYLFVTLPNGRGGYSPRMVHTLVLETWHGARPQGHVASHLNGDRDDNRPLNLVWESQADNLARKRAHGTHDEGFTNSRASMTPERVAEVFRLREQEGLTHLAIAKRLGVGPTTISRVLNRKRFQGGDAP